MEGGMWGFHLLFINTGSGNTPHCQPNPPSLHLVPWQRGLPWPATEPQMFHVWRGWITGSSPLCNYRSMLMKTGWVGRNVLACTKVTLLLLSYELHLFCFSSYVLSFCFRASFYQAVLSTFLSDIILSNLVQLRHVQSQAQRPAVAAGFHLTLYQLWYWNESCSKGYVLLHFLSNAEKKI